MLAIIENRTDVGTKISIGYTLSVIILREHQALRLDRLGSADLKSVEVRLLNVEPKTNRLFP